MIKKTVGLELVYKFDPVAIPNWKERLTSAYEMLFQKIDEMEHIKNGQGIKTK